MYGEKKGSVLAHVCVFLYPHRIALFYCANDENVLYVLYGAKKELCGYVWRYDDVERTLE